MIIVTFIFLYLSVGVCWMAALRATSDTKPNMGVVGYVLAATACCLFWPWLVLYTLFCKLFTSI